MRSIYAFTITAISLLVLSGCNVPEDDWQADSNEWFFTWTKTIYYDEENDSTIIIEPRDWSETYHFTLKFNGADSFARFYKGNKLLLETKFHAVEIIYYYEWNECPEYDFCYDFEDDFRICTADGDGNGTGLRLIGFPWFESLYHDNCKTYSYFTYEIEGQ